MAKTHAADIIDNERVFQYIDAFVLGAPFPVDLFCIRVHFSFSLLGNVVLAGQLKHIKLFLQYF